MRDPVPLCVDLDGTLVKTDTLWEAAIKLLKTKPWIFFNVAWALRTGLAPAKRVIAQAAPLDVKLLPYNRTVLDFIRQQRAQGQTIILTTASDYFLAHRVADHLGVFDEVIASDGTHNLSGRAKGQLLVERFGKYGFDYIGNSRQDIFVWQYARHGRAVSLTPRVVSRAVVNNLRPHHWVKNLLLFVPLIMAHQFYSAPTWRAAALGWVAFSLAASAMYLINDLFDLESDRRHVSKRDRPLAAGDVPLPLAGGMIALLLGSALLVAWWLPPTFLWLLIAYGLAALLYSVWLKRLLLVDVLVLSSFYVLRLVAGGAATAIPVSHWLLGFALCLFLSMALLKRYAELRASAPPQQTVHGRGYAARHRRLIGSVGSMAAVLTVIVFGFYLKSHEVMQLYRTSLLLWCIVPLLMIWLSRVWLLAYRGRMHEDPILFATHDVVSYLVGALCLVVLLAAL